MSKLPPSEHVIAAVVYAAAAELGRQGVVWLWKRYGPTDPPVPPAAPAAPAPPALGGKP